MLLSQEPNCDQNKGHKINFQHKYVNIYLIGYAFMSYIACDLRHITSNYSWCRVALNIWLDSVFISNAADIGLLLMSSHKSALLKKITNLDFTDLVIFFNV